MKKQTFHDFELTQRTNGQCVGLLDEKPGVEPQAKHQNKIRKVFPLSRFLAKTRSVK